MEINFAAPPTGSAFMQSEHFFRLIARPAGQRQNHDVPV